MYRFTLFLSILLMFAAVVGCDDGKKKKKPTVEICDNGVDDTGNGLIDCDDPECADDPACEVLVEICDDGIDNTGNDLVDCDDPDCVDDPACVEVNERVMTIIGTSDLHSHLMGVGPAMDYDPMNIEEDDGTKSGLARVAAVIKAIRAEKEENDIPVILVDSGDSLMGDMVDLLSGSVPPVFHFFQLMEYDGVMLGNHDWDWTPVGTAAIIHAATEGVGFNRPLLCSNLVTDPEDDRDDLIEDLVEANIIKRYALKVIDDDMTVGIFGLMGMEADVNVPQAKPVTFWHEDVEDEENGYDQIQDLVDEIRDAGANFVVHASHAGINANGIGEDRDTIANVSGIDVVVSGHRHQLLENPNNFLRVGSSYIIAQGKYGEHVSQIDVTYNHDLGRITSAEAFVHVIDGSVLGDPEVHGLMEQYIEVLDSVIGPSLGVNYREDAIAHTTFDVWLFDFEGVDLPTGDEVEAPMGLLIADAQRAVVNGVLMQAIAGGLPAIDPDFDTKLFDVALIELGAVRDPLLVGKTGQIAAADAFRGFPLGIGPDGVPGYPMMDFYVTPYELKKIMDMNAEILMGNVPFEYYMHPSGIRFIYDSSEAQFNKATHVFVCPKNDPFTTMACYDPAHGTLLDITDNTTNNMIRMTVSYYVALSLPEVRNYFGAHMTIEPKKKDGTLIDMTSGVDVASVRFDVSPSPADPGIQELKAWVSLILFLQGLDDDWTETVIGHDGTDYIYLHADEPTDELPSIPSRVYDRDRTATPQDPFWELGLWRAMPKARYCAMYPSDPRVCN